MNANLPFLLRELIKGKEDGDINSLLNLPALIISSLILAICFSRFGDGQ
jgi:hypothetical protein